MRRSKALTPPESGSSENSDNEKEGAGNENKAVAGDNVVVDVMIEFESSDLLLMPVLAGCCGDDAAGEEQVVEVFPDGFDCPDDHEWTV